jgi:hypothetical protein
MNYEANVNLASIFRASDAKLRVNDTDPKRRLFEQKSTKVETRLSTFLIDQRYALQLDELI